MSNNQPWTPYGNNIGGATQSNFKSLSTSKELEKKLSPQIKEHSDKITYLETRLNKLLKSYKESEKKSTDLEILIKSSLEKLEQKETRLNEVLAIFITLFTFISVNVNIFTKVKDLITGLTFMIIMTICSIILVTVLFTLVNKNKSQILLITIAILGLILVTIFLNSLNINIVLNPDEGSNYIQKSEINLRN